MDADVFIQSLLSGQKPPIPEALTPDELEAFVARLKDTADKGWGERVENSLLCGRTIEAVGVCYGDDSIVALGRMAQGDAIRMSGDLEGGWKRLEEAGELFLKAGNPVGWARTRIGMIGNCVQLGRPEILGEEAERARNILRENGVLNKLMHLEMAIGVAYNKLGDYRRALDYYQESLELIPTQGEEGQRLIGSVYLNIGLSKQNIGELRQAQEEYQRAAEIFKQRDNVAWLAVADLNMASIAYAQGKYRQALQMLYRLRAELADRLATSSPYALHDMIECYVFLNRYEEARDLAYEAIPNLTAAKQDYVLALILQHLAVSEAELGNYEAANAALDQAEAIFTRFTSAQYNAATLLALLHLKRAHIALRLNDPPTAHGLAQGAAAHFHASGQAMHYAQAVLLIGRIELAEGRWRQAHQAAAEALEVGDEYHIPPLRYGAHMLLGRAAELQQAVPDAIRHYRAAVEATDESHQSLTITLRTAFLDDKQEAMRRLIALYLQDNCIEDAFYILEHAKSQLWMGYLTHREALRWSSDNPATLELVNELNDLRADHHWYFRVAHEPQFRELQALGLSAGDAQGAYREIETRIRKLTEQLYLDSESTHLGLRELQPLTVAEIQQHIASDELLLEFFADGDGLGVFMLDGKTVCYQPLDISQRELAGLVEQLRGDIDFVLAKGARWPHAPRFIQRFDHTARQLYDALFKPLEGRLDDRKRLKIVPHTLLHYLPFNLLKSETGYLIERCEIVVLPSSSLLTRPNPRRSGGAWVLADPWEGRLPRTVEEAALVHGMFNDDAYVHEDATRERLAAHERLYRQPCQVLHIAAHGQYRLDQPEFSFIQLAGEQLFTDDLLQYDLSYELVTLSACESGQSRVTASDDLIGLGRSLLFAGAGALIVSLWHVEDTLTHDLMRELYGQLKDGASKASALRHAQLNLIAHQSDLHPAFWGAFQLIGCADPLSSADIHDHP